MLGNEEERNELLQDNEEKTIPEGDEQEKINEVDVKEEPALDSDHPKDEQHQTEHHKQDDTQIIEPQEFENKHHETAPTEQ